jgi:hypothetical protein
MRMAPSTDLAISSAGKVPQPKMPGTRSRGLARRFVLKEEDSMRAISVTIGTLLLGAAFAFVNCGGDDS